MMDLRRFRFVGLCLALLALVWIVFGQTLGFGFVNFDDDKYVYDNEWIRSGLSLPNLLSLFTHWHAALWHPLTSLTHMIDCQLYGLNASGHHFTNVLLHGIAAILLFLVLYDLTSANGDQQSPPQPARNFWPSAFVAALFAIHPMRVESVAWIAERKDVLSAVFLMLSIGAYARYARGPTLRRYLLVLLFVGCGLMSKATFVTVPFVLLLLDYWPLSERTKEEGGRTKLFLEKIPLLALSVVAAALTMHAQTITLSSLEQLPLLPRIKNAAVSVVIYLWQIFWPRDLAVFYPHPHDHLDPWIVLVSVALIITVTVTAVLVRRRFPYVFVGWFWYLGMLVPVLGIVQAGVQGHADRFTYLPHIGLFILIAWGLTDLTRKLPYREIVLGTSAAIVLTTLTFASWRQTRYWHDSVSLWTRALAVTSNNAMAHQDLAVALWEQGKKQEATWHVQESNIIHWRNAVKDFPYDAGSHDQLGVALAQRGEIRGASAEWRTSLQIDPADGNAANNLAWVLATTPDGEIRDGGRAVELAERASRLPGGENPMVLRTLAAAYAESGRFTEASETGERAAELAIAGNNPSLAETLRNEVKSYNGNKPHRETVSQ